jgi:hypothetical protein
MQNAKCKLDWEILTMNDEPDSERGREREDAQRLAPRYPRPRWPPGWSETSREGRRTITKVFSYVDPMPDSIWVIEHDPDQGTFRLTGPDGKTSTFRDKPVRHLVLQAHYQTGELEPRIVHGSHPRPMDLYLCPEQRSHENGKSYKEPRNAGKDR